MGGLPLKVLSSGLGGGCQELGQQLWFAVQPTLLPWQHDGIKLLRGDTFPICLLEGTPFLIGILWLEPCRFLHGDLFYGGKGDHRGTGQLLEGEGDCWEELLHILGGYILMGGLLAASPTQIILNFNSQSDRYSLLKTLKGFPLPAEQNRTPVCAF